VIGDPDHLEHKARLAWLGGHFELEEFDLASVNRKLKLLNDRAQSESAIEAH